MHRIAACSLLALAACTPRPSELRAEPAPATVAHDDPTPGMSAPRAKAGAPIRAVGYPMPVGRCLPDPAQWAGFTKDGAFGYCASGMSLGCELVDRDGRTSYRTAQAHVTPYDDEAKERALRRWIAASGPPALPSSESECVLRPPPLRGTWAWGEITVVVKRTDGAPEQDAPVPSRVWLGGEVDGEDAVFPVVLDAPSRRINKWDDAYGALEVNVLALSTDGDELGIVTHVFRGEYSDQFEVRRIRTSELAAGVYRLTAQAARRRGDVAHAAAYEARASGD